MTYLLQGAAAMRPGSAEKTLYVLLACLDLTLTLVAFQLGLTELNPYMSRMLSHPVELLAFKVIGPVFIAWLVPGKLLIPAVLFLAAVTCWNVKELLLFLL